MSAGKKNPWDPPADGLPSMPETRVPQLVEPVREVGGGTADEILGLQQQIAPLSAMWQQQQLVRQVKFGLIDGASVVDEALAASGMRHSEAASLKEMPSVWMPWKEILLYQHSHARPQKGIQKLLLVLSTDAVTRTDANLRHLLIGRMIWARS